jgi:DNA polymerase-3 subunit delta'
MGKHGLASLPQKLRDSRAIVSLAANIAKGRVPHAMILRGADPKSIEAAAFAICGELLPGSIPPQQHPDVFALRPTGKARQIQVGKRGNPLPNTMRQLLRDLLKTSNQGGYKVAIVFDAERMNHLTANAFLKTLEEPPPQTVILLLTCRPYDLLPTIRSRCFQFVIDPIDEGEAIPGWDAWQEDYRDWIRWLHADTDGVRREPHRAVLQAYGLITRFSDLLETTTSAALAAIKKDPDYSQLDDDALDAAKVGISKGIRDRMLRDIEESTRFAAIELSHVVAFPATLLARVVAELESITGLLALNVKDDTALESFFIRSLRIWTTRP